MPRSTLSSQQLKGDSHRCKVYRTANQTTTTNASTGVVWTGEEYDVSNMHAANSDKLVAQRSGTHVTSVSIFWFGNTSNDREVSLYHESADATVTKILARSDTKGGALAGIDIGQTLYAELEMAIGDKVYVNVFQNSGSDLAILGNVVQTALRCTFTLREVK